MEPHPHRGRERVTTDIIPLAEAVVRARGRATIERGMRAGVARLWLAQGKAFPGERVAKAALALQPRSMAEVADPDSSPDPLMRLVAGAWPDREGALGKIISLFGARSARTAMNYTLARIGYPRADSLLPVVVDWLADHSLSAATGIEQVSMERIRRILADGVASNRDARAIARDIRAEFTAWSKARAEMVARTEVAEAWEESQYRVLSANGWDGVEWLTADDERVDRDNVSGPCVDNQAAGVVPVGTRFPSGHLHPPAHPLCRCTLMPAFG